MQTLKGGAMTKFGSAALFAAIASIVAAPLALGQLTDAEFKCQAKVSKAGAKFVSSKAKCASKCITNAGKSINPYSDCFAPYTPGTTTGECIDDTTLDLKGAEDKFRDAI